MLTPDQIAQIADELAEADRTHGVIPRITTRYPKATMKNAPRSSLRPTPGLAANASFSRESALAKVPSSLQAR